MGAQLHKKSLEEMTLLEAKDALWNEVRFVGTNGAHRFYMEVFDVVRARFGGDWSEKHGTEKLPLDAVFAAKKLREYARTRQENPGLTDYLVSCSRRKKEELFLFPTAPVFEFCLVCNSPVGTLPGECQPTFVRL